MNRLAICLSLASLALGACGSEPAPDAAAAASASKSAELAAAASNDPVSRMARAVGNGKPGAAVNIRYDFLAKPAVGTPTELQVAFIPNAGVDAMDVVFSGMEGLTLAGPLSASFASVEPAKPYLHTVSVLPDYAGVFYLSVVVTTQIGNSNLSRTFSIPLAVGNVPARQKATPQTDAAGEPIQPMKAQETTQPG
jgi:hypothetical protein